MLFFVKNGCQIIGFSLPKILDELISETIPMEEVRKKSAKMINHVIGKIQSNQLVKFMKLLTVFGEPQIIFASVADNQK